MSQTTQKRIDGVLITDKIGLIKPYSYGAYDKSNGEEQWIRISQGCPHNCPYCYEPTDLSYFGIPPIIRNNVKIMDMNLLAHREALESILELGEKTVNNKPVHYQLICGIDHRFLTNEIAIALEQSRFKKIRIAWDWDYNDQRDIWNTIRKLKKVGYISNDIQIFMICNWKISYEVCMRKLNNCKYWGVQVADCYFDGQISPNIIPIHWSYEQIRSFRSECRKHNQIVNFQIDPEV